MSQLSENRKKKEKNFLCRLALSSAAGKDQTLRTFLISSEQYKYVFWGTWIKWVFIERENEKIKQVLESHFRWLNI